MKKEIKLIFTFLVAMLMTAGLSAQVKVRLGGIVDWDKETEQSKIGGMRFEVIGDNLGFGFDAMADFNREEEITHSVKWEGELFLSYHLLGNSSFIDPYLQAGYGNGGSVSWRDENTAEDLTLSLYPSLGAGVNVVFEEGLVMGCRWGNRPENNFIPGTNITRYDLAQNQFTLQLGVQLGGREPRYRKEESRDHSHGSWKWCWCED
jgi:hypothetical protein